MKRRDFWSGVLAHLEAGQPVFVCLVAASTKGSPGSPGAALALAPEGDPLGTIGGGAMELAVLEEGRASLVGNNPPPVLKKLIHRRDSELPQSSNEAPSGLICGGSQTHVMWVLDPEREKTLIRRLVSSLDEEEPDRFLEIDESGPRLIEVPSSEEGFRTLVVGETWIYRERLYNPRRVAVFGGGHCGSALARVLGQMDFSVTVVERRSDLFTFLSLPEPQRCTVKDFTEGGPRIRLPERTLVVVMTSDFPSDVAALRGILPLPFPFLGVMGAPPKLRKIREALSEAGFSAEDWARITAPVGLVISSDTPEEIAVSVAAQILLQRETLNLW